MNLPQIARFALVIALSFPVINVGAGVNPESKPAVPQVVDEAANHYVKSGLSLTGLSQDVFKQAYDRWQALKQQGVTNILSIVDLSKPSTEKRLFIVDLEQDSVLYATYVAHGRNSGENFATSFSNVASSFKSSLGLYLTGDKYIGKHGLSLTLRGMDKGLNDNAESRAIVLHGAEYVSEDFIKNTGRLGRSLGCPAVSTALAPEIIHKLKRGSALFLYHPQYFAAR